MARKVPWWVSLLIPIIVSLLVSGFTGYHSNDKRIEARISALEAHRVDDNAEIVHIRQQVDKLVEWALGKK